MDGAETIHKQLSGDTIYLDKVDACDLAFQFVGAFVNLSRDNGTVEKVTLCLPFTDPDNDDLLSERYAFWDKIAQGIGNLQALREIVIFDADSYHGHENPTVPDWEILACILRRLRRGVQLRMHDNGRLLWDTETLPAFAGVIRGHAMITSFSTGNAFAFDCLDILCSALRTLPALENVFFDHDDGEGPEEAQSLESMVKLLQSPTLRIVEFEAVVLTNTLCQAVAKALKEGSEITDLRFLGCSFPEGGGAVIARALKTNTTLEHLDVCDAEADEVFYEVLAAALLSNSTLQYLECSTPEDSPGSSLWLSPLFLALQVNSGLKELSIDGIDLIDETLGTAMRLGLGLGNNSTLETLKLCNIISGDNDTCLWREALSFLRTNKFLKTLNIQFEQNQRESHAATIRMEVLAMLCENESLETLFMMSEDAGLKDYRKCVEAIQSNTTLKRLELHEEDFCVDQDEFKDLIPVLKKNYGLEELPELCHDDADFRSILDLNRAGRRYLVHDGSSISKGVAVLSRVSNDINSVFLHLLENPRLCDRSAVEMSSSSIGNMDNVGSTMSPGNRHSGDKREPQAPSPTDKETRRRLE
jgi:hypothetical protein